MKHCTIIYDSPALAGIFAPHASGEAAFLRDIYSEDMKLSVERMAEYLGISHENLFWRESGVRPLHIRLVCPDELAERVRDELRDHYIIELDCL